MPPVDWFAPDWGGRVHEATGGPASKRHEDDGGDS